MVLENNILEDLENRIKDLEQGKKKAEDENRFLYTFLLYEIGSKDLESLRKLLAGQKLTEILVELDKQRQIIQNLHFDLSMKNEELSKLRLQYKDLEKEVKVREEETKAKQESINFLEGKVRERQKVTKANQEIINDLKRNIKETIKYLKGTLREEDEQMNAQKLDLITNLS